MSLFENYHKHLLQIAEVQEEALPDHLIEKDLCNPNLQNGEILKLFLLDLNRRFFNHYITNSSDYRNLLGLLCDIFNEYADQPERIPEAFPKYPDVCRKEPEFFLYYLVLSHMVFFLELPREKFNKFPECQEIVFKKTIKIPYYLFYNVFNTPWKLKSKNKLIHLDRYLVSSSFLVKPRRHWLHPLFSSELRKYYEDVFFFKLRGNFPGLFRILQRIEDYDEVNYVKPNKCRFYISKVPRFCENMPKLLCLKQLLRGNVKKKCDDPPETNHLEEQGQYCTPKKSHRSENQENEIFMKSTERERTIVYSTPPNSSRKRTLMLTEGSPIALDPNDKQPKECLAFSEQTKRRRQVFMPGNHLLETLPKKKMHIDRSIIIPKRVIDRGTVKQDINELRKKNLNKIIDELINCQIMSYKPSALEELLYTNVLEIKMQIKKNITLIDLGHQQVKSQFLSFCNKFQIDLNKCFDPTKTIKGRVKVFSAILIQGESDNKQMKDYVIYALLDSFVPKNHVALSRITYLFLDIFCLKEVSPVVSQGGSSYDMLDEIRKFFSNQKFSNKHQRSYYFSSCQEGTAVHTEKKRVWEIAEKLLNC